MIGFLGGDMGDVEESAGDSEKDGGVGRRKDGGCWADELPQLEMAPAPWSK